MPAETSRWSRPRATRRVRIAVLVLVALCVLAFIAATFRLSTVDVTVASNEITTPVTFAFYVDGRAIASGILGPSQKASYRVPFAWWFWSCEPHVFRAVGSAGEPFPGAGYGNLTVCAGSSSATVVFV